MPLCRCSSKKMKKNRQYLYFSILKQRFWTNHRIFVSLNILSHLCLLNIKQENDYSRCIFLVEVQEKKVNFVISTQNNTIEICLLLLLNAFVQPETVIFIGHY